MFILPYMERAYKMIGNKIRQFRIEQKLSESELARRCNIAVSTLYNIETGVSKNPSWYTICKIAKVLKVDLNSLNQ